MASQNYLDEVFGEKSAEPAFQTVVLNISEKPIEEDTYYYSEERSCAAKCLAEFRQTRSGTLSV